MTNSSTHIDIVSDNLFNLSSSDVKRAVGLQAEYFAHCYFVDCQGNATSNQENFYLKPITYIQEDIKTVNLISILQRSYPELTQQQQSTQIPKYQQGKSVKKTHQLQESRYQATSQIAEQQCTYQKQNYRKSIKNKKWMQQPQNGSKQIIMIENPKHIEINSLVQPCPKYAALSCLNQLIVGLLIFKIEGYPDSYMGTGFLVEKNIVMTCAHNLYSRVKKKRSIELVFWPGRNGLKGDRYQVKNFYYPEQYQKSQIGKEQQFDYGVIQLEDSIGSIYGYLGLNFLGQKEGKAELAGYPLEIYDKNGKQENAGKKMYTDKGQFCKISQSEGRIRYTMGTSPGQSGSPIFREQGGEYYVVGVHTNGGKGENEGVLLDKQKRIRIGKWIWSLGSQAYLWDMELEAGQIRELLRREKQAIEKKSSINLSGNKIGAEGANHLGSGNLANLTTLNLQYNKIGDQGAKHLASGNLTNLTTLDLNQNNIGDQGAKHLASGNLTNLTTLNLQYNKIGDQGAKHLAPGNLTNLTTLNLYENNIALKSIQMEINLLKSKVQNVII